MKYKDEDLKNKIKFFESAIFSVQETHYQKKGKFKIQNFVIFESIRKNKENGGSMLGIHVALQPVLIKEYNENFELIVVEIKIADKSIRVMTGYGPQETWTPEEKMPYFVALEHEISTAELEGKSTIITMDANSKLGKEYVPGDPHPQSANGKILAGIIERNALIVGNGILSKRKGLITRELTTVKGIEQSVIDFVLFSSDLLEHLEYVHIDDKREYVLTKITKIKGETKNTESDHNIITTKFNLTWTLNEETIVEVFKYKDKESKDKFKHETTVTRELTKISEMEKPLHIVTNKLMKRLRGFVHKCFKKVKITNKVDTEMEKLYNERRLLKSKTDPHSKKELDKIEEKLATKYSDKMCKIILGEVKDSNDSEEGGFNTGSLWKIKKKLSPRPVEPPTAMKSKDGKLLTDKDDILNEAVKHYKEVFRNKPINKELIQHMKDREKLCMQRLKECSQNKTEQWTISDVTIVLKALKPGKSKDPHDFPNELFMPDVAGDDLINAITKLVNRIKNELTIPELLNVANVTNLFKNKGEKALFDSYRGVFRIPVIRNILELLMHHDEYEEIDSNLTNCNVGGRKRRNVRDNLFVINAVMNESKQKYSPPIDIDAYDVEKCFDNLWLLESINDLYENGLQNDKLNLLYLLNKDAQIAIRTSSGTTERFDISNTIMQGTVWANLMCTSTMDKLCKLAYQKPEVLYKYRKEICVPPLQMVDDIITASECGITSVTNNAIVNAFIDSKKLKLSESKCAKIHIGDKTSFENCSQHSVREELMKSSEKEKYVGDILNKNATSSDTLKNRKIRGYAVLSQMTSILSDIPLGKRRIEMGLELRQAWFLNGVLFNSEVWIGTTEKDLDDISVIDHKILRLITGSQAKAPTQMLYLETSTLPVRSVISVRRLMYLHTVLSRHEDELTRQFLDKMRGEPLKGDWIHLAIDDLNKIGKNEEYIKSIVKQTKQEFKTTVKNDVRQYTLVELNKVKQKENSKIRNVLHTQLVKPQNYLLSNKLKNKHKSLLFNLRSKCVNGFKDNFHGMHQFYTCQFCGNHVDSQENALTCESIIKHLSPENKEILRHMKYEHIFGSIDQQLTATKMFEEIINIREELQVQALERADRGSNTGPPAVIFI